jgi:transcription elongation factor SPT6
MSMQDLIQGEAELDDEENDESFDEETGEVAPRKERQNGHMDDSSEEEDDDDDEEAAREVCPQVPITALLRPPLTSC